MAKPSPKATPAANRRRNQSQKPEKKDTAEQKNPEIILETPLKVDKVVVEVSTQELNKINIDLLEKYTLQSCADIAKAMADAADRLSKGITPQTGTLQMIQIASHECKNLLDLLVNIKEQERKLYIAYAAPKKIKAEIKDDSEETVPDAAE